MSRKKPSTMEINEKDGTCCDIIVNRVAEKKKKKNICRTRKKVDVAVFPQLKMEEEDIDLEKQFFQEKWPDDNECMWLSNSSDSSSPSTFFEEYRFSALSVDDWVISWLSTLADSYLYLDKSTTKNPEEDHLKLTTHQDIQNDVVSVSDSESSRFSFEDSSLVFSENSRWVSDSTELHSQDADLEEPLFWPSEWKSEWSSPGTWKCFSMSPRRGNPDEKFSSPEMLDCKQNHIPQLSRLRNSSKLSDDIQGAEDRKKIVAIPESRDMYRDLLEDDITGNQQVSIESLLGLGEFDGHEGLDSEFNDDVFSIDDDSL